MLEAAAQCFEIFFSGKFSGKHLWYSPNINKIFNRLPEGLFNNRTTHIEE